MTAPGLTHSPQVISPLDFSISLQSKFEAASKLSERKERGQFFTPPEVCRFMAERLTIPKRFRLLDPGAGVGSLTAAVCERVLASGSPRIVEVELFENDEAVAPYLRETLEHCQVALSAAGHRFSYRIHNTDFILDAASALFGAPNLFAANLELAPFDAVIMNPPYFKLAKDSAHARLMGEIVHGQPNMYAFFLAVATEMLRPNGELVAITPRSFCNGLYFRNFRRWFLDRMSIEHIHVFESRRDTFREVLQESVVFQTAKRRQSQKVTITSSFGKSLHKSVRRSASRASVLDEACGDWIIRIPASNEDADIVSAVEKWPRRFSETGLRISTGPVVSFRATEHLLHAIDSIDHAPLLSVHNVKPFRTEWPLNGSKHPIAVAVCEDSRRILLPARNYVLLRRFSAKEETRRLTASPFLGSQCGHTYIALENHLNYICNPARELTINEVYGLTAFFNSTLIDRYFRTLSGNTQVNATELRTMRFPELETMARIGKRVRPLLEDPTDTAIQNAVLDELEIGTELRTHLLGDRLL